MLRLDSRKVCIGHWLTAVLGRASASSLPIAIVITIVSCTLGNDSVPAIRPRLAECVLTAGKHTLKPTRTHERWQASHEIGDLAITIEDGGVTSRGAGSPEVRWTQKNPGGTSLRWAGADEKILYLTKVLEKESKETTHQAPQIHRIRLSDVSWLDPIDLPVDKAEPNTREVASACLSTRGLLIVLTSKIRKDEKSSNDGTQIGYRVTGIDKDPTKVVWSRAYPSAGSRSGPGVHLWAPTRPDYATDDLQPLTLLGNLMGYRVLVCAGPLEDLLCLGIDSGEEKWRLAGVWEYERGFIGPSEWRHTLGRYGMERSDIDLANGKKVNGFVSSEYRAEITKRVEEARERVRRQTYAMIAGPVVVPAEIHGTQGFRIFLAVARSDSDPWPGFLSACVIYEINELGLPVATATLPRLVNGWELQAVDSGVVFGCPRDSILRLAVSEQDPSGGRLGRDDKLCRLEWYRDLKPQAPKAWLSSDAGSSAIAFTGTYGFRACGGGYILNAKDRVYHFPLVRIELKSGVASPLLVDVPFEGEIQEPETNSSRSRSGNVHANGPYLLSVTWLEVRGGALRIVLGSEKGASAVDFDLAGITEAE